MAFDDVNEGYNDGEEELHFHYKKGSFREREDQKTRDMATGVTKMSPGLFKALVNTKGNRMMFLTLICVTVMVFVIGFLKGGDNQNVLSGVKYKLTAYSFEEQVYVSLEMNQDSKSKEKNPEKIEVVFNAIDSDGQVSNSAEKNTIYDRSGQSFVRTSFTDYDLASVVCSVSNGKDSIELKSVVEKK